MRKKGKPKVGSLKWQLETKSARTAQRARAKRHGGVSLGGGVGDSHGLRMPVCERAVCVVCSMCGWMYVVGLQSRVCFVCTEPPNLQVVSGLIWINHSNH